MKHRREQWRGFAADLGLGYDAKKKEIVGEFEGVPVRVYETLRSRFSELHPVAAVEVSAPELPAGLAVRSRRVELYFDEVGKRPTDLHDTFACEGSERAQELLADPGVEAALLDAAGAGTLEFEDGVVRLFPAMPRVTPHLGSLYEEMERIGHLLDLAVRVVWAVRKAARA